MRDAVNRLDAKHMMVLARDLITLMPSPFKETLKSKGCLFLSLEDYSIQVASRRKFPIV